MINTEIDGRPKTVEGAARWLREALVPAVDTGVDALAAARKLADSDWRSDAGDSFSGQLSQGIGRTDDLATNIGAIAAGFDQYAADLRAAKQAMAAIRQQARAAGLTVNGYVIEDPGAGPTHPGEPADQMTPRQADHHSARVNAFDAHQQLVAAYDTAAADADAVVVEYVEACEQVRALRHTALLLKPAEIIGVKAIKAFSHRVENVLAANAEFTKQSAAAGDQELARRRYSYYPGGHEGFYKDLEQERFEKERAQDAHERHQRNKAVRGLGTTMQAVDKLTGPIGLGLDIHTDIKQGESKTQAVTSNVGGAAVGAAAGAGAASLTVTIATAVGVGAAGGSVVPVVGTTVGVVVGLGVGIIASGAIDSVFEKGPDVGAAVKNAKDDLWDTAKAGKDLGGSVLKGIGGVGKTMAGAFG